MSVDRRKLTGEDLVEEIWLVPNPDIYPISGIGMVWWKNAEGNVVKSRHIETQEDLTLWPRFTWWLGFRT